MEDSNGPGQKQSFGCWILKASGGSYLISEEELQNNAYLLPVKTDNISQIIAYIEDFEELVQISQDFPSESYDFDKGIISAVDYFYIFNEYQEEDKAFWNLYSPTTIIAPISRQNQTKAKLPTHYPLEAIAGLSQPSIVLLEQVRVVDKKRLERRIGTLPAKYMRGVEKALKISIGLTPISTKKTICLCSTCANRIRGTGAFLIRRQFVSKIGSELCTSCSQNEGVEYEIAETSKR